jgi:hypothetical protein
MSETFPLSRERIRTWMNDGVAKWCSLFLNGIASFLLDHGFHLCRLAEPARTSSTHTTRHQSCVLSQHFPINVQTQSMINAMKGKPSYLKIFNFFSRCRRKQKNLRLVKRFVGSNRLGLNFRRKYPVFPFVIENFAK